MRTFILLSGLAGSGKSTWANQYFSSHKNVKIVSSDGIRFELTNQYQDFTHEKEVWEIFSRRIKEFLESSDEVTVIADSTNFVNRFRTQYAEETKSADKKIIVFFRKPLEVVIEQNRKRNKEKFVPEYAIISQYERWEEPTQEVLDLYDEVIEVK